MKRFLLKKRSSRWAAALLTLLLFLACSAQALAYGRIDTGAAASLTARAVYEKETVSGVGLRLYRVAEVTETAEYALTGSFSGADVSLKDVDGAGGWTKVAAALNKYVEENGISADRTAATGADGSASFAGLSVGLYLLAGDSTVAGDYAYTPTPAVLLLPTLTEGDAWSYSPAADVKCTRSLVEESRDVTVKKVWSDGDYSGRPESVTVCLLRDGALQDTVTLSAANGWTCTWEGLAGTYEEDGAKKLYTYTVREENVAAGYTATVSRSGDTFTVTNTRAVPAKGPEDTLAQTGIPDGPIPVLAAAGLALCLTGRRLGGRKKRD